MHASGCVVLVLVLGASSDARAQLVTSDYLFYVATLATPAGALPPIATAPLLGMAQASPQLVARYAYLPDMDRPLARSIAGHVAHSLNSAALTAVLPLQLDATISLTAGAGNSRCDGCGVYGMAAVGGDYRVLTTGLGEPQRALRLAVGLSGEVGMGNPSRGSAWSIRASTPLAVSVGDPGKMRIVPFVVPGFLFVTSLGELAEGGGWHRTFLFGGGVTLFSPRRNVGASVGFQYISIAETDIQLGATLSFGGR